MPLNFPLNPFIGQSYTQGNYTWVYNGVQWITTVTLGYRGSSGEGFQGSVGFQGSFGFQGSAGFQGTVGFQGSFGYQGSPGFQGSFGFQGSAGFQGSSGFVGSIGAPGQANVVFGDNAPSPAYDGLLWLNTNNAVFSAWSSTANAWIGLNGGVTGPRGYAGSSGFQNIPLTSVNNTYVPTANDAGRLVHTTSNVTINTGIFANGDNFSVYNNSGANVTIIANTGVTLYFSGTDLTGNRVLIKRGIASIICVNASSTFVVTGNIA